MAFFSSRFSLVTKYSSSGRDFVSTNQDGDNCRKVPFLAAKRIHLEIFQIFVQDLTSISPNIQFSFKSSIFEVVLVGFSKPPPLLQNLISTQKILDWSESVLFLLLMDGGLSKVMQAMSLEEDEPVMRITVRLFGMERV